MKFVIPSGALICGANRCGVEESLVRRRFLDSAIHPFGKDCFAQNDIFKIIFFWFNVFLLTSIGCSSTRPVPTAVTNIVASFAPQKVLRHFTEATALSVDRFGNAFVLESSSNSIIKISPNGDSLREVRGFGDDHYQFNGPCYVDARLSNAIFVADRFNHRIEQYTKDMIYSGTLYTRDNTDPTKRFGYPAAVAADDGGNIYVADGENKRVLEFRSDYSFVRTIGGFSEAMRPDAILSNPVGLAVDADEHLIVLDNGGSSLVEYDNLGNFIARIELDETGRSICTQYNEIVVLIPDRSMLRLFVSHDLTEIGSLKIERDSTDMTPLEGIAKIKEKEYLLSRQVLYEWPEKTVYKSKFELTPFK